MLIVVLKSNSTSMNIWALNQSMSFFISQLFSHLFHAKFFDFRHIQEDVNDQQLPTEKKVEEMTEEERSYLYFKVHDLDGNDKLDGLEIFYSATHHSASDESHEHAHEHNESSGTGDDTEVQPSDTNQPSNDSSSNVSNLKLLELDENGQIVNTNFNHIIGSYFILFEFVP